VSGTAYDFDAIRRRTLRGPRVTSMLESFERIAAGAAHVPTRTAQAAPDFVRRMPEFKRHSRVFTRNIGTFFRHGCASIPYCIEQYARVDIALCRLAQEASASRAAPLTYYETCSADGTRARTLAEYSLGRFLTLTDSPNESNRRQFDLLVSHPYSLFHKGTFADITPEFLREHAPHPAFADHFDIIWENTTFQMFGPNRDEQIAYVKRVLKHEGLMLFFEKMNHADAIRYATAEEVKDAWFKAQHFSSEDIALKRSEILTEMEQCQVTLDEFVAAARIHFATGVLIWNCGNFYEIVASDSPALVDALVSELPAPYVPSAFAFEHPVPRRLW
jgi:hypothetical protein